jgi:hypothetical protein
MHSEQFIRLPLREQEQYILKKGVFLGGEDDYSYRLLFYIVDQSVIELMYDNETNTLVNLRVVDASSHSSFDHDLDADPFEPVR